MLLWVSVNDIILLQTDEKPCRRSPSRARYCTPSMRSPHQPRRAAQVLFKVSAGLLTLIESTILVRVRETSSFATPGISATALTREPSSITSVNRFLTSPGPIVFEIVELLDMPHAIEALVHGIAKVFIPGPARSICENMFSILLFRLPKPSKSLFQVSSIALVSCSYFILQFFSFLSALPFFSLSNGLVGDGFIARHTP